MRGESTMKPEDLSLIPGISRMEEENQLQKLFP